MIKLIKDIFDQAFKQGTSGRYNFKGYTKHFYIGERENPIPLWVGMKATLREKQQLFSDHVGIWWCFL